MRLNMHLTVIICAYNAANRLPACLQALALSTLKNDLWDVLVVDNASRDETALVAIREWRRSDVELRVVQESTPGLLHARQCGVRHSLGDVLVFVDDDNLLSPTYLEAVREAFLLDPHLAIFGGRGIARFEAESPPWVGNSPRYLAVGPQAESTGYISIERAYVYGAGSAFRKANIAWVYRNIHDLECTGRSGNVLTAGDDVEVCMRILAAGGKIYYNENATFEHGIEARRLEWGYQLRLFEGFGAANAWLGLLRRQLRRNEGPLARFRATLGYTLLQAAVCIALSLVFKVVPWCRMPQTKRTLHIRSFAAMCQAIFQRKSSLALHRKAVSLVRAPQL